MRGVTFSLIKAAPIITTHPPSSRVMAGIASHLLEFPPEGQPTPGQYDSKIRSFLDSISKLDSGKIINADSQQDFLQVLDPRINSISYLYILALRYKSFLQSKSPTQNDARTLLLQALSFMQQFDSVQVRYVGNSLRELIESALTLAAHLQQASLVRKHLVNVVH